MPIPPPPTNSKTEDIDVHVYGSFDLELWQPCFSYIKGTTFRISNMGNETEATIQELIDAMDDVLASI